VKRLTGFYNLFGLLKLTEVELIVKLGKNKMSLMTSRWAR